MVEKKVLEGWLVIGTRGVKGRRILKENKRGRNYWGASIDDMLNNLVGKRVRITVEVVE